MANSSGKGLTANSLEMIMCSVATVKGPLQLDWNERDRKITVTPEDQDRFNLTVEEAIKACQANDKAARFISIFLKLITTLADWSESRQAKISNAYITVQNRELLFLVVQTDRKHDFEFEDQLTDLDLRIADDEQFCGINLHVLALPGVSEATLSAFIDRGANKSIQVFPHAKRN